MTLALENIEKSHQVTQNEFESLAVSLFQSVSLSNEDSRGGTGEKEQTIS